jgi:hypothetical protein
MESLINYLDVYGNTIFYREAVDFRVTKFSDLTDKVIPFFQNYSIQGVKHLDYLD